jgi:uncharacterized coiled-coil DUF342 family protein
MGYNPYFAGGESMTVAEMKEAIDRLRLEVQDMNLEADLLHARRRATLKQIERLKQSIKKAWEKKQ